MERTAASPDLPATDEVVSYHMAPLEAPAHDESPSPVLSHLPVARIDESGLRALQRRAHELAQIAPADLSTPPDRIPPASLLQLLSQPPDDSLFGPRSQRSA